MRSSIRWRPVVGYEGYYSVSDNGKIRSEDRIVRGNGGSRYVRYGKLMTVYITRLGYLKVTLYKRGKQRCPLVHRLVATAFIANPNNKPEVNHLDGVKTNNAVDNLEWSSRQENVAHAVAMGLQVPFKGVEHGRAKLTESQVIAIRRLYSTRRLTQKQLATRFKVPQPHISRIVLGRVWKHLLTPKV